MTRTPYPYQAETVDTVWRWYDEGMRTPLVVLPTGCGKTYTALLIVERAAQRLGRAPRVGFWAHRSELVDQTIELFGEAFGRQHVGRIQAGGCEFGRDTSVGMIQTAVQPRRLARLAPSTWDIQIVDEAHHSVASTYRRVLARTVGPQTMLVGLTATPDRTDGIGLIEVYGRIHEGISLLDAIEQGFLVEPFGIRQCVDVNLDDIPSRNGDFAELPLAERMKAPAVLDATIDAWLEHAERRKTIGFAVRVDHAALLAERFNARGVRAAYVHGGTSADARRKLYDDLRDGELDVLLSVGVLTEGFDERSVACVMLVRPTQSLGLYKQMIGRGLRTHAPSGKRDCLVLDVTGTTRRKSLITLAMLGGLPAEPLEKEDPEPREAQDTRRDLERTVGKDAVRTEGLLAVRKAAERFNLFTIPRGRRYVWTENQYGHFLWLGAPTAGMLVVRPDRDRPGRFRVVHVHQRPGTPSAVDPAGGWRWDVRAENQHALDAIGLCEQEAPRFSPDRPGACAIGPVNDAVLDVVLRDIGQREAVVNAARATPIQGASRGASAAAIAELRRRKVKLTDAQEAAITHGELEQMLRVGHAAGWRAVTVPKRLKVTSGGCNG